MNGKSGTLFVVATPIGNLEDITFRALRVLKDVDAILCEDTRHTRKMTSHFDIHTRLISLHRHNEQKRIEQTIEKLLAGENFALVSDAGTPVVSDPGSKLVKACIDEGISVVPIPGASAPIVALSASGADTSDGYLFLGFLPEKKSTRKQTIEWISTIELPVIIFLPPHDATKILNELSEKMPDRRITIARELTKIYEQFSSGTLKDISQQWKKNPQKGEITIVLDRYEQTGTTEEELEKNARDLALLLTQQHPNKGTKEIASIIADKVGIPKRKAYRMVIEIEESK